MADINITALYESDVAAGAKADAAAVDDLGDEVAQADRKSKGFALTGNKVADALLRGKMQARGFGFALSSMRLPTYIALFKFAVPLVLNLSAGILALSSNIGRLSGLMGALPGAILSIGTAFGVVKLATMGVGDAMKEMMKPGAKLADVQAALKGMPPEAQAFAKQLAGMKPYLEQLRGSAAGAFLPGLSGALRQLTALLPTVNRMLSVMGLVMGELAMEGARMVGSVGWARDLNQLGSTNAVVMQRFGRALLAVLDALRHVAVAAQPMTLALGALAQRGGEWLRRQAEIGRETGRLEGFFNRSVETMRQWGRIFRNLGGALYEILKGGSEYGGDLADSLERITARWYAWTKSTKGTERILRFFNDAREPMRELGLLGSELVRVLFRIGDAGEGGVAPTLRLLRTEALPALEKLITGLDNNFLPSLVKLVSTFGRLMAFTSFEPFVTAVGIVSNLALALMKVIDTVPGLSELATVAITVGIALKTWNTVKTVTGLGRLVAYLPAAKKGMDALRLGTMGWTAAASGATGMEGALMGLGGLMVGPVGIVIAIAAVVAALVLAYQKVNWFRDGVNAAAAWVVDAFGAMVDFFGRIPGYIKAAGISIFNYITWPYRQAFNAIVEGWNQTVGRIPGLGGSLKASKWQAAEGGFSVGDTTRPRSGRRGGHASGNLAKTMAVHQYVDSVTPGRRTITSGVRNFALGSGDSDHPRGRALDLTGSYLNAYRQNLAAVGGYGAMHGSGSDGHLHMAVGDSTRPRASMGIGGGDTIVLQLNGPLVNFEQAPTSELEITQAVNRGIRQFVLEREERR